MIVYVYHKIGHCFKSSFSIITFKHVLSTHMFLVKPRFKHDVHENFTWYVKISHMLFSQIQGGLVWTSLQIQLLPIIQVLANYNLSKSSSALHETRNWVGFGKKHKNKITCECDVFINTMFILRVYWHRHDLLPHLHSSFKHN